jgi:hypothetical protein
VGAEAAIATTCALEEPALADGAAGALDHTGEFFSEALVDGVDQARRAVAQHDSAIPRGSTENAQRQVFPPASARLGREGHEAPAARDRGFRGRDQQPKMVRETENRIGIGRTVGDDPVEAGRILEGACRNQILVRPSRDRESLRRLILKPPWGTEVSTRVLPVVSMETGKM